VSVSERRPEPVLCMGLFAAELAGEFVFHGAESFARVRGDPSPASGERGMLALQSSPARLRHSHIFSGLL
jgi:hypothetical protein